VGRQCREVSRSDRVREQKEAWTEARREARGDGVEEWEVNQTEEDVGTAQIQKRSRGLREEERV
jgi:hypothetical protein